jgi:hypothetical protein
VPAILQFIESPVYSQQTDLTPAQLRALKELIEEYTNER